MTASSNNIEDNDPHHFDFDLDRGIREQVVEKLETSPLLQLSRGVGPALSAEFMPYILKANSFTLAKSPRVRQKVSGHCGAG